MSEPTNESSHEFETDNVGFDVGESHHAGESHEGAWQEEHPPVDDFHDPVAEEGREDQGEASEEASLGSENAPQPQKRGKLIVAGVVVGGLLLAGGLAYTLGGKASDGSASFKSATNEDAAPSPAPSSATGPAAAPVAGADAKVAGGAPPPVTPTSAEVDMSSLYNNTTHDTGPGSSASGVAVPANQAGGAATPVAASAAPTSASLPETPKTAAQTAILPSAPATVPASAVVAAPTPDFSGIETRLASLADQITALQKTLDQNVQQVGVLSGRVDAIPSQPVASSGAAVVNNPELDQRLGKLEQKIAALEQRPAVAVTPVVASPVVHKPMEEAVPAVAKPVVSKPVKKAEEAHHVLKKTVAKKKTPSHKVAVKAMPATKWVLRAATPGGAWIAKDDKSLDLKRVQIGDNVPGIGTVRAIKSSGGSWVVEGSTGSLR